MEIKTHIKLDFNFEETYSLKDLRNIKSQMNMLNYKIDDYYKKFLTSHTSTFDEMFDSMSNEELDLFGKYVMLNNEYTAEQNFNLVLGVVNGVYLESSLYLCSYNIGIFLKHLEKISNGLLYMSAIRIMYNKYKRYRETEYKDHITFRPYNYGNYSISSYIRGEFKYMGYYNNITHGKIKSPIYQIDKYANPTFVEKKPFDEFSYFQLGNYNLYISDDNVIKHLEYSSPLGFINIITVRCKFMQNFEEEYINFT